MRRWYWVAVVIAALAVAFLVPLLQAQNQLSEVQGELTKANEQVEQGTKRASELETAAANLKNELDAAQAHLKESQTQGEGLRAELEKAKGAADEAKAEAAKGSTQITAL